MSLRDLISGWEADPVMREHLFRARLEIKAEVYRAGYRKGRSHGISWMRWRVEYEGRNGRRNGRRRAMTRNRNER